MKESPSLRQRFLLSLVIYTLAVLALWFIYHTITSQAINRSERERVILVTDNLTRQISAEFERMNAAASVIAGSEFVFDFLRERDTVAYYEKAAAVSEIVRRAAFPVSSADSVVTIGENGRYYRFSGGLSNRSLETLRETFTGAGIVYTIIELDNTMFFCHNVPVIDYSGRAPVRLGNILMLTGLDRTGRMLDAGDGASRMVMIGGVVALANDPALEGLSAATIEQTYGAFLTVPVPDTSLTVAAAVPYDVLYPENALFLVIAIASLGLLLAMIVTLYGYQSKYMIQPMAEVIAHIRAISGGSDRRLPEIRNKAFDQLAADINKMLDRTKEYNTALIAERQKLFDSEIARQNMRLGLLSSQIDAHFVVNTLKNIKRLADMGINAKAGEMADGLAAILQHRHAGDALVNVFDDFVILEKYVDIMNMKFDGKFTVEYDVADPLEACLMPGFVLQPLVENALTHGLQNKERDARLTIKGFMRDGNIIFIISDNGQGIPSEKLKVIQDGLKDTQIQDFPEPGLRGVALMNIARRIRIQCGEGYGITLESAAGKGTTVTVVLPVISDEK